MYTKVSLGTALPMEKDKCSIPMEYGTEESLHRVCVRGKELISFRLAKHIRAASLTTEDMDKACADLQMDLCTAANMRLVIAPVLAF